MPQSQLGAGGRSMRTPLASRKKSRIILGTSRRLVLLLCLLSSSVAAIWADDSSIASQYIRTDFTIDDGLPDSVVNTVIQTENGLLWVGTGSGLASFDGRTFTPVPVRIPGAAAGSTINSLVEGPDGDLWVGGEAGVVRIPKRDLNDSYVADSKAFRLGDQQSDAVEVLFRARDGTIWAGTNHGLYRFDGIQFLRALPSVHIARINQALNGRLMLTTSDGVLDYDGKAFVRHAGLGALLGVHDDQIFDVLQDSEGRMWYGTRIGIRSVVGGRAIPLSPHQPATTATFRIQTGPNGAIWVSTGIGLYRVAAGSMWTPAPDLPARSFWVAKDGEVWIGTNGRGLVHLHPRLIRMYTSEDGLPSNNIVMAVLPSQDGHLWVGSNCGLSVFDGSRFKNFIEKDGLKNTCVWSLAEDRRHDIWIGTYGGGIFQYRNGVFRQYTREQGLASRIAIQIAVARDDSLWIATPDGVSRMQAGSFRNYTTADGLSSTEIRNIHQDHAGTIWVATEAGIDRLVSDHFDPIPAMQVAEEVLARRLVEDSAGNLYTTDTPQGISQIRNGLRTPISSTLNVSDMVEDPDHTLWFSGRNGVIRVRRQALAQTDSSDALLDYEEFNRADGFITTQSSGGAPNIAMTPDGKLWIATVKGLAMIDTSSLSRTGRKPNVFISGVTSDGKIYPTGKDLVLRPGIHRVELNLAAIDLSNPQKIRLQYRLEGVDSDWLDATSSRKAVYTNIPEGTHELLARVTDSIGHWGSPQIVYEVTQQPYFYATPLFEVSITLAVVLLLVLAYVLRVRHVVKQARIIIEQRQIEREAVARDLHDTFLQGVQGLILQFHTGTQKLEPGHPVRQSFEEALRLSDGVMLEGRSVLSRLRARKTKPESLSEVYAAVGNEFRSLSPAQFNVIVSGRGRELDADVQEELLKIGREALFNAYRHAQAGKIELEIHYGIFEFRLRFRDDGVGIDPGVLRDGSIPGHFGLPGMRERISRIGGHMDLWSRPGAGTEIEIRIPFAIAYRRNERNAGLRWIRRLISSRAL